MSAAQLEKAVQHATTLLDSDAPDSAKAGRDALDYLKSVKGLTQAEREQAIVTTAIHAASKACDAAMSQPNTLLRSDTAYSSFIKNTISDYSTEFQEAVKNSAQDISNQIISRMPQTGIGSTDNPTPTLDAANMPRPGFRPDGNTTLMDAEAIAAWDQFYEEGGKMMVQAQTENLSKLHPVALNTLQACEVTAREKFQHLPPNELEPVVNSMNVNNTMLRVSTPVVITKLTTDPSLSEDQQKLQRAGNIRLAQVAQTYFNGAENTQAANITRQMRADATFTQATDNQLKAACRGQLQSTATIAQEAPEAGKMSVRDALRSAGRGISHVATSIKNTITDKVDDLRASRLNSQLEKRQDHALRLEERQLLLDHIKQCPPEQRQAMAAALAEQLSNQSAQSILTGSDANAYMDVKDKLDLWKMDERALDKAIAKNEQRMDRNTEKLASLSHDKQKLDTKMAQRQSQDQSLEPSGPSRRL